MAVVRSDHLTDLAARLGLTPEAFHEQVGRLSDAPMLTLRELGDAYGADALDQNKFMQRHLDQRVEIPPFGYNPRPSERRDQLGPFVQGTYHRPMVADHPTADDPLPGLLNRRRSEGVRAARLVYARPEVRATVSKFLGGEVLADQRSDGVLTVRTGGPKRSGAAGNPSALGGTVGMNDGVAGLASGAGVFSAVASMPSSQNLHDLFHAMDYEILMQAALMGQHQASGSSFGEQGRGAQGGGSAGPSLVTQVLLGKGSGQGLLGPQVAVSGLLGQSPEAASASDSAPSVDLGVLQLKRMIDKRDQMITAVKNVLDKWNQTAKVAIDNTRA